MLCGGIQCAFLRCFCPFSKGAPDQSPVCPICRHGGCVPAPKPSVSGCRHGGRPCVRAQCARLQTREGCVPAPKPSVSGCRHGGASLRQSPVCPVAATGGASRAKAQCVRLQTRSRLEFVVAVHRDSKYESQVPTTHYSLQQTHRAWRGRKPTMPVLPATATQDHGVAANLPCLYCQQLTHRAWRGRKPTMPVLPATDTQGLA